MPGDYVYRVCLVEPGSMPYNDRVHPKDVLHINGAPYDFRHLIYGSYEAHMSESYIRVVLSRPVPHDRNALSKIYTDPATRTWPRWPVTHRGRPYLCSTCWPCLAPVPVVLLLGHHDPAAAWLIHTTRRK